ncbi:MAG: hypothetical protein RL701_6246 [Pseudomonadota bacterium]
MFQPLGASLGELAREAETLEPVFKVASNVLRSKHDARANVCKGNRLRLHARGYVLLVNRFRDR